VSERCERCGIPPDAGYFDHSSIQDLPKIGEGTPLAWFSLHRNYCGILRYFAQYISGDAIETPGLEWEIRCDGRARFPYTAIRHVVNRWGLSGFPVDLRLEEGAKVELFVTNVGVAVPPRRKRPKVGGRILGRYWYDPSYGGAPNPL
jgi:hypothetical protein